MLAIIRCFEAVFGLKANLNKSNLIGVFVDDHSLEHFTKLWGCKVGSFPTSYLGLPLCTGSVFKSLWNPVVERMDKLAIGKINVFHLVVESP